MRPGPIFLGLFIAVALAALAQAQAPTERQFKTANWVGGVYFNGQTFAGCFVRRSYPDGTKIELQLTPRLEMWVGGAKDNWSFNPNQEFELTFEIDGAYTKKFTGKANAQSRTTLWFNVGNDADLRRALAGNGTMTWVDPKGLKFPFPLANSDNAMRKLLACTALYGVD